MNTERIGLMRNQALLLAKANKQAEPGITKVYWFPNEEEVRHASIPVDTFSADTIHNKWPDGVLGLLDNRQTSSNSFSV